MKRKYNNIIVFCLYIILIGGFFYKTVVHGLLPIPSDALVGLYHPYRDYFASEYPRGVPFKNYLITDPVRQQIPWKHLAVESLKRGRIPKWNPYSFSGTPLIGNIQAGIFYPLNVVFFLLDFDIAWTIFLMLQSFFAMLCMYVFLKQSKMSDTTAIFGSIIWSFSGVFISWFTWGTIGHVILWLPLMLFSIDKIFDSLALYQLKKSKKRKDCILSAGILVFSLVMSFLAGHSQMFLYVLGLSFAYFIRRIFVYKLKKEQVCGQMLPIFTAVGFVFLALISVQVVPFMRMLSISGRVNEMLWERDGWFLPLKHLVQFIAPDFFGNPATLNYWGVWNYGEFNGYIGVVPLVFSIHALFLWFTKRRMLDTKYRDIGFWVGVIVIVLLFLVQTPFAKLPFILSVPIVSFLQPSRLLVILVFSLVMLSVNGFEMVQNNNNKPVITPLALIAGMIGLLWGAVYFGGRLFPSVDSASLMVAKRNLILPTFLIAVFIIFYTVKEVYKKYTFVMKGFFIFCVVITIFDVFRFGWKFTPFTERKYFFPKTALIEYLLRQEKPFRVMVTDDEVLPPNVLSYYAIESVNGYDPLYSLEYEQFAASNNRNTPDINPPYGFNRIVSLHNINAPLWRILNVKYVITKEMVSSPSFALVFEEGQTKVYEVINPISRAYFADVVFKAENKVKNFELMYALSEGYSHYAVTEEQLDQEIFTSMHEGETSVDLVSFEETDMSFHTITPDTRLLVVSNIFHPFWKATINEEVVEISRVNHILQGIVVPKGEHLVRLYIE